MSVMQDKSINMGNSSLSVNKKILAVIERTGISYNELGRKTGLSPESVRRIALGYTDNPGVETLNRIAEALAVPVIDLISEERIPESFEATKIKVIDPIDFESMVDLMSESPNANNIYGETVDVFISKNNQSLIAIKLNDSLAENIRQSGMLIIKTGDILIFNLKFNNLHDGDIIIYENKENLFSLGVLIKHDDKKYFLKSIDHPIKQTITQTTFTKIKASLSSIQFC